MKKLFVVLLSVVLYGCGCLAQIPPQYVYVDSACSAVLPDYLGLVVVSDNCAMQSVIQTPPPGTPIESNETVIISALDMAGNEASVYISIILLDTIAPLIQLSPNWTGYTTEVIGDMYKVYYGWVQEMGDLYNERVAGTTDTVYAFDTVYYHTYDSMDIFFGTIPITDPKFRMDQGYWQDTSPDLTAWF